MKTDAEDSVFRIRVHQGHIDNFRRKIQLADNRGALERLLATINAAAASKMIEESDRVALNSAISDRRQIVHA